MARAVWQGLIRVSQWKQAVKTCQNKDASPSLSFVFLIIIARRLLLRLSKLNATIRKLPLQIMDDRQHARLGVAKPLSIGRVNSAASHNSSETFAQTSKK
jgi:hypothetical protein